MQEIATQLLTLSLHLIADTQNEDEFKSAVGLANVADTYGPMLLNFSQEGQYYFDKYNVFHGKGFFNINNGLLNRVEIECLAKNLFKEMRELSLTTEGFSKDTPFTVAGMHTVYNGKIIKIDFYSESNIIGFTLQD
ncbi:MAG TPA: hypothetical protein VFO93_20690 [Hymenobacter sp.]|uniref:hypothetical protein n=1 Tax=Hymenobacter sp. TaxID=1898978 RepID=UPI002D80BD08|nr:hypothetical protein [Hymenobacter sp.]HET9505977.1 hypothetical protein [Hymenobacter sp.]